MKVAPTELFSAVPNVAKNNTQLESNNKQPSPSTLAADQVSFSQTTSGGSSTEVGGTGVFETEEPE